MWADTCRAACRRAPLRKAFAGCFVILALGSPSAWSGEAADPQATAADADECGGRGEILSEPALLPPGCEIDVDPESLGAYFDRDEDELFPPGRSVAFAAELELTAETRGNRSLGEESGDDSLFADQQLQLALGYRPAGGVSALGEIKLIASQTKESGQSTVGSDLEAERGEMWLYFDRMLDSDFSAKVGRQNFFEPRRWWWDADLDAARVFYRADPWWGYLGIARELAPVSTKDDDIAPEEEDVVRLLGQLSWRLSDELALDLFFLSQSDDSDTPSTGATIAGNAIDDVDADLTWAGLRLLGAVDMNDAGSLGYRIDTALVTGNETVLGLEPASRGYARVTSSQRERVRGWAVDVGLDWTPARPGYPTLLVDLALGSGDGDPADGTDRSFRQTGLQDREEEFRTYGEVLRPELSNLSIASVTIAFPVHDDSLLALGYHHFRQLYAAPFIRSASLDIEPNGLSKDIGGELTLFYELREWDSLQIDFAAGVFRAGDAYGSAAGNWAHSVFFKMLYEF